MASSSGVKKKFPQFDVVKDASDHKYFATKEEVASGSPLYKAIMKEWKTLQEHLPESIHVRVYETRMELMRAVIVGPTGTPYHDGLFFFDILFPSDYPQRPPTVTYWSYGYRLNPNLYNDGYVCLSLLNTWRGTGNEKWVPKESTLLQLLVSLEGLVLNERPYFNEPDAEHNMEESQIYNETAFVFSLKTMSCLLRKPLRNFEDFISEHFRDRSRTILTSCQAYINGFLEVGQYRDDHTFLEKRVKVKESLKTSLEPCYKSLAKAFKKIDPSLGDILDQVNQLVETTKGEYKRRKKERKEERKRRKIEQEREEERKRKQERKEERKRRKIEEQREEERKRKQERKEERKRRKLEQEREEERKRKQEKKEERKRRKMEERREEGRTIKQEGKRRKKDTTLIGMVV